MTAALSRQRNTPLSFAEAQLRLQEYGLQLVSKHEDNRVTTTTVVDVACAAGHKITREYGHLRKRGCPECKAPFGERLLYALLRHYADGLDDWGVKVVKGLDPTDRQRKVVFDVASESRRIAIENHSDYHDPDKSVPRFEENISKEERLRLDALKEARDTGGVHTEGPMKGWQVGVVWFEATRVATLRDVSGSYLPSVIEKFKQVANLIGLQLREDGIEIDASTVYAGLGRNALAGIGDDFQLVGPWLGRTYEHRWRHSCGGEFNKVILELEKMAPGKTGCPFCDRESVQGKWLDFLDRLEKHGYLFAGENRLSICTEHELVPMHCSRHPESQVRIWTRAQWYQWFQSLKANSTKSIPPPCAVCAETHTQTVQEREKRRLEEERQKLDRRLQALGFELASMLPTSVRDPETGKVKAQKNKVRCLNPNCKHEWEIYVAQQLPKAEKRGQMGCPNCNPLKKGPKPKARLQS